MHVYARQVVALLCVALAGCAMAPSLPDFELEYQRDASPITMLEAAVEALDAAAAADVGPPLGPSPGAPEAMVSDASDAGSTAMDATDDGGEASVLPSSDGGPDGLTPGDADADADADRDAQPPTGSESPDPAPPEQSCVPLLCFNRCGLLPRCCNADDECACQDLTTRQCTLPSL